MAAAHEVGDHLGIDGRAAAAHPAYRVGELLRAEHPVLEQVADPLGRLGEQLDRVPGLEVLGEHEHAHRGPVLLAQLPGGLQALDRVGRRHPDVDHRHVGALGPDQRQQLLGVAGLADHLETLEPEQLGHARAEQDACRRRGLRAREHHRDAGAAAPAGCPP